MTVGFGSFAIGWPEHGAHARLRRGDLSVELLRPLGAPDARSRRPTGDMVA